MLILKELGFIKTLHHRWLDYTVEYRERQITINAKSIFILMSDIKDKYML